VRYAVAHNFSRKANLWKKSFTHLAPLPGNGRRHTVELNLDTLRRLGIQPGDDERRLVFVPGKEAERSVDELLVAHGLASKKFIHFQPGSRWLFKCWPAERAAGLIGALSRRGESMVLTAGPDERERAMIAEIRDRTEAPFVDFSGKSMLNFKQLAALTARAKLFIGVDSAPMHMAAAVQTPTVALFGPSGELEWGPWNVAQRVVTSAHACRPCGLDGCGGGKVSECLTTLAVDPVHAAARELLAQLPRPSVVKSGAG